MQSSLSHDPEPNFHQLKLAADKFLQKYQMLERVQAPFASLGLRLSLCLIFSFNPDRGKKIEKKRKENSLDLFLSESVMEKCTRTNVEGANGTQPG